MRKINHNTTLIKESEVKRLIENIVRRELNEGKGLVTEGKKLEKVLKAVAAGTMTVASALAFLYGPTDEEMRDANPNNVEMNRNVRDFSQPNDSLHHGTPVSKITPMKNESIHLTPKQFQQVIRESVCRILMDEGYQIGNPQMLDEASFWQNLKSGVKAISHPTNWKQYYNIHNANYDAQNAADVTQKQSNAMRDLANARDKRLANARAGKKTGGFLGIMGGSVENEDDIWRDYQNQAEYTQGKYNREYDQNLQSRDNRVQKATRLNGGSPLTSDQYKPLDMSQYTGRAADTQQGYNQQQQQAQLQAQQQQQQWEAQMAQQFGADWKQRLQQTQQQSNSNAGGGANVGGGTPSNP